MFINEEFKMESQIILFLKHYNMLLDKDLFEFLKRLDPDNVIQWLDNNFLKRGIKIVKLDDVTLKQTKELYT